MKLQSLDKNFETTTRCHQQAPRKTSLSFFLLPFSFSIVGNNMIKALYSTHITPWHNAAYAKLSCYLTTRPRINSQVLCTACTSIELAKFRAVTFMHICLGLKFGYTTKRPFNIRSHLSINIEEPISKDENTTQ